MDVNNTMERVNGYQQLYEQVFDRVGDQTIALASMHEAAKDRRMDVIRASQSGTARVGPNGNDQAATPKQIGWLRAHGIAIPAGLTKAGASEMIDSVKAKAA